MTQEEAGAGEHSLQKSSYWTTWPLGMGRLGETSATVQNYLLFSRKQSEETNSSSWRLPWQLQHDRPRVCHVINKQTKKTCPRKNFWDNGLAQGCKSECKQTNQGHVAAKANGQNMVSANLHLSFSLSGSLPPLAIISPLPFSLQNQAW